MKNKIKKDQQSKNNTRAGVITLTSQRRTLMFKKDSRLGAVE